MGPAGPGVGLFVLAHLAVAGRHPADHILFVGAESVGRGGVRGLRQGQPAGAFGADGGLGKSPAGAGVGFRRGGLRFGDMGRCFAGATGRIGALPTRAGARRKRGSDGSDPGSMHDRFPFLAPSVPAIVLTNV